ncbi:signal recognition particle [Phytomonospora endophytica]|uniref:pPIWI-RE three-gene island domain-containing protein n=1 Tax=Phytomonospora endophytica TaxID=714109 RepID=A0A841FGG5_9ACTN|nr:signal recognition particle [Phytomonospora endophytica]MBB6032938.1 hypothetical protein [Phytomonospora endophytica]GIG65164.1 hypothetical protein Pen01_14590 [Phytomonospora endophytica]
MRDTSSWHEREARKLRPGWPSGAGLAVAEYLDTELVLSALVDLLPHWTAQDAWVLLTGYPYARAYEPMLGPVPLLRLSRLRCYVQSVRRRTWLENLDRYGRLPDGVRTFRIDDTGRPSPYTDPASRERHSGYRDLLDTAPPHRTGALRIAGVGEYVFRAGERQHAVHFTEDLPLRAAERHDFNAPVRGGGKPITVTKDDLLSCAHEMDVIEAADPEIRPGSWVRRLARVETLVREHPGAVFQEDGDWEFTLAGLVHLVGMVGAGKSTVRDILAFYLVRRLGLRVGILVADVADSLDITDRLSRVGVPTAPIVGRSTRERHIHRLHRRRHTAGEPTMLHHDHPGFDYLSSACPADALRGFEGARPLPINDAPCTGLVNADADPRTGTRLGCPLWADCPRQRGARQLVDADVWVGNPASALHSRVPSHQIDERVRFLEVMARRCDVIIVDEADRVQMAFDIAFAPAVTLYGRHGDSWLDEVTSHGVRELVRLARAQLSNRLVEDWVNAVGTANLAANRVFGLLLKDERLREWARIEYFSAFTLHHRLLADWGEGADGRAARVLSAYRDRPVQVGEAADEAPGEQEILDRLSNVTLELLSSGRTDETTRRLRALVEELAGPERAADTGEVTRLEFTLLLAALHNRLNFITWSWRAVESILNLEPVSNVLSHYPPRDYEPILAEAAMGNILGFQFIHDEQRGEPGGVLRFFRYEGLGRQLLRRLDGFCALDGRPGPHVLLMSATSWAGTSTRYHLGVPVTVVLRPNERELSAISASTFEKLPLRPEGGGQAISLSGQRPENRPAALRAMLKSLAVPPGGLGAGESKLDAELSLIDDLDRKRILLLVGSYVEAQEAAAYLSGLPEWRERIVQLVPDDADNDHSWLTLRRGDVARFPEGQGQILIAPLLAVERGHNIVLDDGKAAIGSVLFLARPHPRPDDINLAIHALNDWTLRKITGSAFAADARAAGSPDDAGREFRKQARVQWGRLLARKLAWSNLGPAERVAFTWDQLVTIWQVIGRAVRGGVPTRVVFADAAFFPREAYDSDADSEETSLLVSMRAILTPYFDDHSSVPAGDRELVRQLYRPLYEALSTLE